MIEALIVVMYIAILAAFILPKVTGAGRRAAETNLRATLHELRTAIASFQAETGLFTTKLDDLTVTAAPDNGLSPAGLEVPIIKDDFHGPYLLGPGGRLPVDRATGKREWDYRVTPPNVGRVSSLAQGVSLDGEPYSTY